MGPPAKTEHHRRERNAVTTTLVHLRVAEDIRAALNTANIPCAFLKGTAFVDTLYDSPAERTMGDVDILVPARAKPELVDALENAGLTLCAPHPAHPASWRERYNWKFRSRRGALVEMHFEFSPHGLFDVDVGAMLSRVVVRDVNRRSIPTLSPEDTLLGLAMHAANHGYGIPEHNRVDVVRLIERWQPDWDVVCARATDIGATTAVYVALVGAEARGAEVPGTAIERLTPRPAHLALLRRLIHLNTGLPRLDVMAHRWAQALTLAALTDGWPQLAQFGTFYAKRRARDARVFLAVRS